MRSAGTRPVAAARIGGQAGGARIGGPRQARGTNRNSLLKAGARNRVGQVAKAGNRVRQVAKVGNRVRPAANARAVRRGLGRGWRAGDLRRLRGVARALRGANGGRLLDGGAGFPGLPDDTPAVAYPLDPQDPDGAGLVAAVDPAEENAEEAGWQTTRYLRVTNATGERLTLYVQLKTQDENEEWVWFPTAPGGDQALVYELEPGQVMDLESGDWRVNGSRVRVWAESASREYVAFRDKDLWLVPEKEPEEGTHGYEAADIETFELAIR